MNIQQRQHQPVAIIIGATSGIGLEVAGQLAAKKWRLGIAGRREDKLRHFQEQHPNQVEIQQIDVTQEDAPLQMHRLIERIGRMDVFLLCAGIGSQNPDLQVDIEQNTANTNVCGFIRMVTSAFHYFKEHKGGHIAVISSIAGTKGLGVAPAYSATKRFQNTYIEALAQLAHMQKLAIRFTDIRPGFVNTDLLKGGKYPMLMQTGRVAARIVKAIERQERTVTIDWRYRLLVFFWRLIPHHIWERLSVHN